MNRCIKPTACVASSSGWPLRALPYAEAVPTEPRADAANSNVFCHSMETLIRNGLQGEVEPKVRRVKATSAPEDDLLPHENAASL